MIRYESTTIKQFIYITLITSIWINLSEVFRYFVFVGPMTQDYFNHKSGIAEIDPIIFSIWGIWDTLLTGIMVYITWLFLNKHGYTSKSIIASGTLVLLTIFVIFWIATANMGLSNWSVLFITLPLSWIEMVIGAWIVSHLYKNNKYV